MRLVGQQFGGVVRGLAAFMRRTHASGSTIVQRLDCARCIRSKGRIGRAIGEVGWFNAARIDHGIAERHTLAIGHHGDVVGAKARRCNLVGIATYGKDHRGAAVRGAAWAKAHVVRIAGDGLHLIDRGGPATVAVL